MVLGYHASIMRDLMRRQLDDMEIESTIRNAAASIAMDGFTISEQQQKIAKDILKGEITADEVIQEIIKKYFATSTTR